MPPDHRDGVSTAGMLDGLRVLNLGLTEATAIAGRIFADLGATVVRVAGGHGGSRPGQERPEDRDAIAERVWSLGAVVLDDELDLPSLGAMLVEADIVITTPYEPGAPDPDRDLAPDAVWAAVTPFGLEGPRSHWIAGDLGMMASSGNLYLSGYGDRAPVRCSEPVAAAHLGPEIVVAALFAARAGGGRLIDISGQEAITMANMGLSDRARTTGQVLRRDGGRSGVGTSQVWQCEDGFVGLALGGGIARQPTMDRLWQLMAEDGIPVADLAAEPWRSGRFASMSAEEQAEVEDRISRFFRGRSAAQIQQIAYRENLMMAAVLTAPEILNSEQLIARDFFVRCGDLRVPGPFARVSNPAKEPSGSPKAGPPARSVSAREAFDVMTAVPRRRPRSRSATPWPSLTIVEFMTSGAGPLSGKYYAEHGADVIRVETRARPDFLRTVGGHADYGLDASPLFDSINAGKRSVALDLTRAEGRELAAQLALCADVVTENFAPRTMPKLGLDYASLVESRRDLIMVSSCLSGQTGPHKDFPGFGGQGSALSGYTYLTGWPDRVPLGPAQAITDSISPRFVAVLIAAMVDRRERTGLGGYADLSQVETAAWTLSPWLAADRLLGTDLTRWGNRDSTQKAVPHGVFPCLGHDRWIAVAVRDDAQWERLAEILGDSPQTWATLEGRLKDIDAVEAAVATWTSSRDPVQIAGILQSRGVEAVPVADGVDSIADPQLHARGHYQVENHSNLGERFYERTGFRVEGVVDGYVRPSPRLGEHTSEVLGEYLGLATERVDDLVERGIVG